MDKWEYSNDPIELACFFSQRISSLPKNYRKQVLKMCKKISNLQGKTAQQLLKDCGLEGTVPVDLRVVLQKIEISALPYDFSALEASLRSAHDDKNIHVLGALATKGENAAIFYNEKDIEKDGHRYRFTIAHEIGHCCLAHNLLSEKELHIDWRIDGVRPDEEEIAANIFAGELLVPEDSLFLVIKKLLFPTVNVLADIFEVSENVMYERLKHLGVSDRIAGYNY